jgi:putative dimethyl sulfoxide reductase chaperone
MVEEQAAQVEKRGRNMEWTAQFEGQMLVCALLARALYGVPDRSWLDMLIQNRVFDSVPFASASPEFTLALGCLQRWMESVKGGLNDAAFANVRDDYTRLFVGPGRLQAAPWESVYTNKDRAVFQRETVNVKNWYRRFELTLASEYNEPADHVGLQFGFMAHLSELTIAAAGIRDGAEVKRLIAAQRGFLMQHALRWVPRWADDVIEHSRTDLFRGLASLACGTVKEAGSFFLIVTKQSQDGAFWIGESI